MLTLTLKALNDKNFINAMLTLEVNPDLDSVTGYRVGRICEVARRELTKASEYEFKEASEFAERDADGKVVMTETPRGKMPKVADGNVESMKAKMDKLFEDTIITIKVHKLDFTKLKGLNGQQIVAIADVCDNLPEEE